VIERIQEENQGALRIGEGEQRLEVGNEFPEVRWRRSVIVILGGQLPTQVLQQRPDVAGCWCRPDEARDDRGPFAPRHLLAVGHQRRLPAPRRPIDDQGLPDVAFQVGANLLDQLMAAEEMPRPVFTESPVRFDLLL